MIDLWIKGLCHRQDKDSKKGFCKLEHVQSAQHCASYDLVEVKECFKNFTMNKKIKYIVDGQGMIYY